MDAIKHALTYPIVGVPVWSLVLSYIALPVINELIQRAKGIKAQSLYQAVGNGLAKSPLYAIPVLKQLIDLMTTPEPAPLPAPVLPKEGGFIDVALMVTLGAVGGLAVLLMVNGCSFGQKVGINVAACTAGQVPAAVASILPDVQIAIAGGSPHWADDLEAIGVKAGMDAVMCAVKALLGDTRLLGSPQGSLVKVRAEAFLAAHGVHQ
jgi:hypothetical protein